MTTKTIDSKVVEMQFDNKNFEKNVSTSMSTIEKLKQSLNFTGASRGLEELDRSIKKVDMSHLGNSVEQVGIKFSALQVYADQTMRRITDSVNQSAMKIWKALAVDPQKTGFQEYETQINAVQTILANTNSKGTTLQQVNDALDELNTYADKTIYNFTEMTRNIGTFTAAGIDLETSVNGIQGIANVAAVSGSTSQQASTAMYQLSQALAAGTVKLMDWNSVVNAGMGGEMFQNALRETSEELGTGAEAAIKAAGSFRESLSQGWITAEVLTETLKKFTTSGANERVAEYTGLSEEAVQVAIENAKAQYGEAQAIEYASKALAEKSGKEQEYIQNTLQFAKNAEDAATKVKTFSQLWDTLKESAQSGWTQTWEIIIGDFEQAKEFFTELSNRFGGVIEKISKARNDLLVDALGDKTEKSWDELAKRINEAGVTTENFQNKLIETAKKHDINVEEMIKTEGSFVASLKKGWLTRELYTEAMTDYANATDDATGSLKKYQEVFDEIWQGDWGVYKARWAALEKAGFDSAKVQELVNQNVAGTKLTMEDLSDAQLENLGYTNEQIKAFRELADEAKKNGDSLDELFEAMLKPSGRDLLIQSIYNILDAISVPLKAIGEAWNEVFGGPNGDAIYNIIAGIEEFTESLIMSEEQAENFKTICAGLFSLWDLSLGIVGKSLTSFIKLIRAILSLFGTDLTTVIADIAEMITKFNDWLNEQEWWVNSVDKVAEILAKIIQGIKDCVTAFLALEPVKAVIDSIKEALDNIFGTVGEGFKNLTFDAMLGRISTFFTNIKTWVQGLSNSESIGADIIAGLVDGIAWGIGKVYDTVIEVCTLIFDTICTFFGIESPSKLMMKIGGFLILGILIGAENTIPKLMSGFEGFANGVVDTFVEILANGIPVIWSSAKRLVGKLIDIFTESDIDFMSLMGIGAVLGVIFVLKKALDILEAVTVTPGEVLETIGNSFKKAGESFSDFFKAAKKKLLIDSVKNIAIAVAIFSASIIALTYVIRQDWKSVLAAVGVIVVIVGLLAGILFLMKDIEAKDIGKLGVMFLGLGVAALAIAFATKVLSGIDFWKATAAVVGVLLLIGAIGAMMWAYGKYVPPDNAKELTRMGKMFKKLAWAMLIIAVAMKVIATMDDGEIIKASIVIGGIFVLFAVLMAAFGLMTKSGDAEVIKQASKTIMRIAQAIATLAIAMHILGALSGEEIAKSFITISGILLLFGAFALLMKKGKGLDGMFADKTGKMFLGMSAAILILAVAIKVIANTPADDIAKGVAFILGVAAIFAAFTWVVKMVTKESSALKAGGLLFAMAAGIMLLAVTIRLIAGVPEEDIKKGVKVIYAIGAMFMAMVYISKYGGADADKAGKMLLTMSFALLVMVGVIALLGMFEDQSKVWNSVAVITVLMGGFAALMLAASKIKTDAKITGKLIMIGLVVALLAGIVYAFTILPKPEAALPVALALSALLLAIAGAMYIFGKIEYVSKTMITKAAQMALVVAALGVVLAIMSHLTNPNTVIQTAIGLGILLIALSVSMGLLTSSLTVTSTAILNAGLLAIVVGILGGVLALMTYLKVEDALPNATALSILLLALSASLILLSISGAFAEFAILGIATMMLAVIAIGGLMVALGELATNNPNLEKFLNKSIPILDAIAHAIGSFFGNLIGGFIDGALSFVGDFGEHLSDFMENVQPFLDGAANIDPASVDGVKTLAEAVLILTGAEVMTALAKLLPGKFGTGFGEAVEELGEGLTKFVEETSELTPDSLTAVDTAIAMAEKLVKLSEIMPKTGGLVQLWSGTSDMGDFGEGLSSFASSIVKMGQTLVGGENSTGLTGQMVTAVDTFTQMMDPLIVLAGKIPQMGGLLSFFTGDNTFEHLGKDLVSFAGSIISVGQTLVGSGESGGLTSDMVEAIKNMIPVTESLIALTEKLPALGGISDIWNGDNDPSKFGKEFVKLAEKLKEFSEVIGETNTDKIYYAIERVQQLISLCNLISVSDFANVDKFVYAVDELGKIGIKSFVDAFTDTEGKIKTAGQEMVNSFVAGIESIDGDIKTAMIAATNKAADAAGEDPNGKFQQAGADVVYGFADGIDLHEWVAEEAAATMAAKAAEAAKDELDSHSPSRVFYEIGSFAGQGFANALVDYGSVAYRASGDMVSEASKGLTKSISKIQDAIIFSENAQPTIRPVLDLSEIETGVSNMGRLLNTNPTIGLNGRVNAINASMNNRVQNGNLDVVSAIDKLRKDIGNLGGTSYNVNGITYDDGSNVANAIGEIVRAIRIDGRS